MSFKYDPKDATEGSFSCLPSGDYELEVLAVEEAVSKAGNDMLKLSLCAYGTDGEQVRLFDYIVNPASLWKLKSICRCCDITFDGTLDEQLLVGKRMKAKLRLRVATDKYPEKNEVVKYIEGVGSKSVDLPDSEVPF